MGKIISILLMLFMMLVNESVVFAFASSSLKSSQSKPQYYTFEDLRGYLRDESFYCSNTNKPIYARVDLGYILPAGASGVKIYSINNRLKSLPKSYRINSAKAWTTWRDYPLIEFDWNRFELRGGQRGDLIFIRANGKGPDLVKLFSNWTHIAIAEDLTKQTVFESLPDTGVRVNKTTDTWGKSLTYYTCKRIKTIPPHLMASPLTWAENKYKGKPYIPSVGSIYDIFTFVYRWCDRNDMESMYCSKLVYNVFRNNPFNVSLNNRSTCLYSNQRLIDPAPGGWTFSWVGVSPDDIYYSDQLDYDFAYSNNVDALRCLRM